MGFMIEHWDFSTPEATQQSTTAEQIQAKHWYHCERLHPDIRGWLEQNQVPRATVDHLLADESRPSFHPLDDENFMLILRGIFSSTEPWRKPAFISSTSFCIKALRSSSP